MDIHFAEGQWVHLLWAVLLFSTVLIWLEYRGSAALNRFVSAALGARLLTGPSRTQRMMRIIFLAAAGVFMTLALMRPQWGTVLIESKRSSAEIMICLDVSRSMLAEDVTPNRLERAKAELRDLLELLDGDQVGLIAFAGRATVLSPLTPDFGFLRLALDDANPASVSRGGTRLEEPIRKAVAGFGDTSDIARSILLITDGEDHDSFPLEAAKAAAERGVRILAIGFGAESGSEIPVTDPATGARTLLRDGDGIAVRTRLDGETLREMALLTEGAYVPAGTGVLDLESIYHRHIAPLTRGLLDGQTRTVRNDAFQWAVLLALLALIGSAMSTVTAGTSRGTPPLLGLALLAMILLIPAPTTHAQGSAATQEQPEPHDGDQVNDDGADSSLDIPADPRAAYNDGIALLSDGKNNAATQYLQAARDQAGSDGETRYRATFNLGWTEVRKADELLESAPPEALEHLYQAAGWFREAVEFRPSEVDARYNLEMVMRRALELADTIAGQDQADIKAQLESLIQQQRGFLESLRQAVSAQQVNEDPNVTGQLRLLFRSLASSELKVLAEAESFSELTARDIERIKGKIEQERTPEDAVEAARLEGVLAYLHQARERMAQTRSRLRRLQAERAYRRGAAGLAALQRARDQLLDPVARIDALLNDGTELARFTALKAALVGGLAETTEQTPIPDWLSEKYLGESQSDLENRAGELHAALQAGLAEPAGVSAGEAASEDPQAAAREKFLAQLETAAPLIGSARSHFAQAALAIAEPNLQQALDRQSSALAALQEAREMFLDLRQLIELTYREEQRVGGLLTTAQTSDTAPEAGQQIARALAGSQLHRNNLERTLGIGRLLSEALLKQAQQQQAPLASNAQTPRGSAGSSPFDQGYQLQRRTLDHMYAAAESFKVIEALAPSAGSDALTKIDETANEVAQAITSLEELRRLFFNVVEHLRETAQGQQRLGDETETLAALADDNKPEQTNRHSGPLQHRQQALAQRANGISEALRKQAAAKPPQDATDARNPTPQTAQQSAERRAQFSQAAELVSQATHSMGTASDELGVAAPALDQVRSQQDAALQSLQEALALLQQGGDQPDKDGQQQQEQKQGEGNQPEQQPSEGQNQNMAQLLQGVRDREAQRRQEQAVGRSQASYEPVEKDW